jgi:hypothetical protein
MDGRVLGTHAASRGALTWLLPIILLSCGDASEPTSQRSEEVPSGRATRSAAPEAAADEATLKLAAYPDASRSIIRRARLELSVADTDEAAAEISSLAERLGGYVGDLTARRRDDLLFYDMTIRVPTARYGEAMADLKGLAKRVESETRSTEDARPILGEVWRPGETAREALAMLVAVLQGLADVAIFVVVFLVPLAALVAVPLILSGRALRRRGV